MPTPKLWPKMFYLTLVPVLIISLRWHPYSFLRTSGRDSDKFSRFTCKIMVLLLAPRHSAWWQSDERHLAYHYWNMQQGILTDREGSVQLTSSFVYLFCKNVTNVYNNKSRQSKLFGTRRSNVLSLPFSEGSLGVRTQSRHSVVSL